MTRPYEIVYIFESALEEQQIDEHLARFHELLKTPDHPNPVINTNHWGKRTLAYPVKGHEVGYYVVVNCETEPENLREFDRALKLDERLLRYLLVLIEGEQPKAVAAAAEEDRDGPRAPTEGGT